LARQISADAVSAHSNAAISPIAKAMLRCRPVRPGTWEPSLPARP
jgi:hypothetical protein